MKTFHEHTSMQEIYWIRTEELFFFSEGMTVEAVLSSYVHSGSWNAIVLSFMQKWQINIVFQPHIGAVFFVIIAILIVKISFCKRGKSHVEDVKLEENPQFIVCSGGFADINCPKKAKREQCWNSSFPSRIFFVCLTRGGCKNM